ncbi:MAG: type IV pilus biogenesis/stability protein PilW [Pseudomonadota bacterium]|nr:type IV pilus biogenesis/stability protein PilW [Pseudomonadota bacterium]
MTIPVASVDLRGLTRKCFTGLLLMGLFLFSGCAVRPAGAPGASEPTAKGPFTSTGTKDHITASDEPEASQRARVRLELAGAYFGRGQMTTALDEVKKSIAADPNVAAAFNLRGLIYGSLGDHRLAEESFRHALQLDPADADSMQNFGWYLCQQSRYGEAEALFAQALNVPQYQDSPRTLLTQGVCQARSGKLDAAERTLVRAYALEPANPAIAVNLSEVLYRRGDLERARFYVRRVNAVPDLVSAQTLWLAVRIENKIGNGPGVADFSAQLRNRFPESPEANSLAEGRLND